MEDALASKRTRAISVINYCESSLSAILATAKTPPALNYIMQHVGMGHDDSGLRAFGEKRGIRTDTLRRCVLRLLSPLLRSSNRSAPPPRAPAVSLSARCRLSCDR